MATTTRERIIANRGRKMSAKQKRYFGSKRQRAALRASRRSKPRHRPRTKPNRGEIIGFTYPIRHNRGKKGNMAQTKKKKHYTRRSRARSGKHKSNPGRSGHHSYGHRPRSRSRRNTGHRVHRYRRNIGGGMGNLGNIALNAVFVIAGALGSKLLTQMVLGSNNTGVIGYAGNAVSGGILWFLAEKVMRNRTAAHGIIAGTAVQIVLRLINDFTPFGQYVSQLGMGDYQAQSFVSPQVLVDPFNSTEIQIPAAYRALAAPAAAGVSGWQNVSDYGAAGSY